MHQAADRTAVEACRRRSAGAADEGRLFAWILLASLGLLTALALPFFRGQVYVADDLGEFHLPLRDFYADQLARGERFDWMPSLYGGFYLTGEGQAGAYHPLHLLLYRWLPLGAAFDLELLLSYPLLLLGTYLLLRQWLARRDAALFGAMAFTFGGFNLLHFVHPNAVAIVAHLPWLLLAIEAALVQPRGPRRATAELALALLTASQLLLGYPQYVWFSLLVETLYAVWRARMLRLPVGRLGMLAVCAALGVLVGAVQWLPTFDALQESTRETPDAEFRDTGALHPLNVTQLVAPYLFRARVVGQNTHELGTYAGAVPLLLCLWLLAARNQWGRFAPLIRATAIVGGIGLLLALGNAGGLYRLQALVPLANHFRFPCRAIVLVHLAIGVGAATALAILRERSQRLDARDRRRSTRVLVAAFLASATLAALGPILWGEYVAPIRLVWCGPALIGAAAVLVALAMRDVRGAWVALAMFTAVDLGAYGLSYGIWPRTADLHAFVAGVPLPPGGSDARIAVDETGGLRTGNRMLLAGLARIDGYAGLEPANRLSRATTPARQRAGARYVLQAGGDARTAARWTPIAPTAPRVRMVAKTVSGDATRGIAHRGFDTVAVDHMLDLDGALAGTARVSLDRPGRIVIDTQAPARQLLVTTERYHHGWQASVDGLAAQVVRVDGDFLACVVDGGSRHVELRFRPASLLLGEQLSLGGLGFLLCMVVLRSRTKSRTEVTA